MSAPINVLIVDDSAVIRQVLGGILKSDGMEVEVAQDPIFAMRKIAERRPDVIVLDLEMPRMDGLTFLRKLMAETPLPVVVCSSLAERGSSVAMQALEEGAVEVIAKPQGTLGTFLKDSSALFIEVVRGAAQARVATRAASPKPVAQPTAARASSARAGATPTLTHTTDRVVAVGASTGGTEVVRRLLTSLPPDSPGLVIVQHIPGYFASAFAKRMGEIASIEVKEAEAGDRIIQGRALLAPGNRHLVVQRSGAHYVVDLLDTDQVNRHRPSVDVLFQSMAQAAGPNGIGALLTGMGSDGAEGLLAMRNAGAHTMAQDEASSVVWGMPKEAIERGAACEVVSIDTLVPAILRAAASRRTPMAARAVV